MKIINEKYKIQQIINTQKILAELEITDKSELKKVYNQKLQDLLEN
jgi:hypothetical protein